MARLLLTALMMWALCFSGANCGSARLQSPQSREPKRSDPSIPNLTLTQENAIGSFPVPPHVLTDSPEVLEVVITKVANPARTPVSIFVFLSDSKKGEAENKSNSLGSFSLYPPDQPGKFLLDAKGGLRKMSRSGATHEAREPRLIFEMKRINESRPWTPVEITIAPPTWRAAEK